MTFKSTWSATANGVFRGHFFRSLILVLSIIFVSIVTSVINADLIRKMVRAIVSLDKVALYQVLIGLVCITLFTALVKVLVAKWLFFFRKTLRIVLEDKGIAELYEAQGVGEVKHDEVLSLLQNSVESVVSGLLKVAHDSLATMTQIVAAVFYTVQLSWEMVLVCFFISGVMLLLSYKNNQEIPVKMKIIGESFNHVYSTIWDHLHNAEVSSFLNHERVFTHLDKAILDSSKNLIAANRVQNASRIFSRFANIIIIMLTAVYGGFMAINYGMQIENILALIIVFQVLSDSIFKIPVLVIEYKAVLGKGQVLDRLYSLVSDLGREDSKNITQVNSPKVLTAHSVSHKYSKDARVVTIDGLAVRSGEIVSIAGASGSGKTSFLKMCAGLNDNYVGEIAWDGVDISSIERRALWRQITLLEQIPRLLPTSIKNNIILHDEQYDQIRLQRAIADAGLVQYIGNLPLGIETEVNRHSLSSGELQKMCLARAFYQQRPVLLIDEGTSALDLIAESHILLALKRRTREEGMLVIAVTHRVNFLAQSDQVLFIQENGSSVCGPHTELLTKCASYAEMLFDEKGSEAV